MVLRRQLLLLNITHSRFISYEFKVGNELKMKIRNQEALNRGLALKSIFSLVNSLSVYRFVLSIKFIRTLKNVKFKKVSNTVESR